MVVYLDLSPQAQRRRAAGLSGREGQIQPAIHNRRAPPGVGDREPVDSAPDIAVPFGFETEEQAFREDRLRARRMRRVLNQPGPTNWLNAADRHWLERQRLPNVASPVLDHDAIRELAERLEGGVVSGFPPLTLASSMRMRTIRQGLSRGLLDAFAEFSDDDLQTVTVIYAGWSFTPAELDRATAAKLKALFRQHLHRVGVLDIPGPLFAVLHGEFEPSSGRYPLHYHVLTTAAKAAALKAGLTQKRIKGYTVTATGSAPVRRSRVRDRVRQSTYLAKAFWPSRPIVMIDGVPKRVREPRRIPEPFGTQVLLWLDRQRFADLVVMNECWSKPKGGTAAMKRLYLSVMGAG